MLKTDLELNDLNELYLNENNMSISNMPAIMVPMPPPLVRQMCYLPEHYPPFAPHSDEPNCPCSFCVQKRFSDSMKEIKVAIKELPQIDLLEVIDSKISLANSEVEAAEKILAELDEKILEQEEEILLQPEEEIVLEPLARGLQDFPIPRLSRSTNDPSTWEPADDEEILLVGI
jgi:hypothetical protein